MSLKWINVADYSFNALLLLERFQIRLMCDIRNDDFRRMLGIALRANPAVAWYLSMRCPERAGWLEEVMAAGQRDDDHLGSRAAEEYVMGYIEDFITYTNPSVMAHCCDFIYAWDKERLFEMADFEGKRVLDVGSGSGRLAFAAAERALEVYAGEPVGTLREFMRDKLAREGIGNVRVLDGLVTALPFPDETFDIVMSGHVVGDDYDAEIKELERVLKPGGWILDCPGDEARKREPSEELKRFGWEEMHYVGNMGGDVYRYRRQKV